jgi:hypothetical protein
VLQSSIKTSSSTFLLTLIDTSLTLTVGSDYFVAGELGEVW